MARDRRRKRERRRMTPSRVSIARWEPRAFLSVIASRSARDSPDVSLPGDCPRNSFFPSFRAHLCIQPSAPFFWRVMDRRFVSVKSELRLSVISGWFFCCIGLQAATWKPLCLRSRVDGNIVLCSRILTKSYCNFQERTCYEKSQSFLFHKWTKILPEDLPRYLWPEYDCVRENWLKPFKRDYSS